MDACAKEDKHFFSYNQKMRKKVFQVDLKQVKKNLSGIRKSEKLTFEMST